MTFDTASDHPGHVEGWCAEAFPRVWFDSPTTIEHFKNKHNSW
ncbi:MAG: hypothetical protein ACXVJI_01990 [Mucilaginibacter sp.]